MKKIIIYIFTFSFLFGCAATYRPINPKSLYYTDYNEQNGVEFSYKHDVLREAGNKKYAKKEQNKGVRLVAIKITNNSGTKLEIGRDIKFYSGERLIVPMEPMAIKNSIRQIVPGYLPYLLLTFVNLYVTQDNTTETYPIGLILGPGITVGNMAVAGSANSKMLYELNDCNLINKVIENGETLYGIIGIREIGYNRITIKTNR